jgi:hypothetical protein
LQPVDGGTKYKDFFKKSINKKEQASGVVKKLMS